MPTKGNTTRPRADKAPGIITRDLRTGLKDIVAAELERLPEYLRNLDEEKRISLVLKLLPYVLPKVESVSPSYGEPFTLDDDFGFPRAVDVHIVNSPQN